ncbi:MAG: hypothetical protein ABL962_08450 [Fimbriimonadaceae bacterium]
MIEPPENFSLADNHAGVTAFLNQFRAEALGAAGVLNKSKRRRIVVAFKRIRRLAPAAALVLAAEMDRWRRIRGVRLSVIDEGEWDPQVRWMLHELGFFDLVKPMNKAAVAGAGSTPHKMIKLRSGKRIPTEFTDELQAALEGLAGPIEEKAYFYEAVTEALANVSHHAYPDLRPTNCAPWLEHRWWATGSFDTARRRLKIIFVDQGIGIPASLPTNTAFEWIRARASRLGVDNSDAAMIEGALEAGRTSRAEFGGGHGLPQMQEYVDACRDGVLRIISGRGEIVYRKGKPITRVTHEGNLGGTLIEWELER